VAGLATGCAKPPASGAEFAAAQHAFSRADAHYARTQLGDARDFLAQGRRGAALRATQRGASADPSNAALQRLRAHLLDELGRAEQASATRALAAQIEAPPPALSKTIHPLDDPTLLVVLLMPSKPVRGDSPTSSSASCPGYRCGGRVSRLAPARSAHSGVT
jgi:hypothetical protein